MAVHKINSIEVHQFKAIGKATLPLNRINVLVGTNNAGKSCLLQAIHFAVALAQTSNQERTANFSADKLRYIPTDLFLDLRKDHRLSEGTQIEFKFSAEDKHGAALPDALVTLTRGRNSTVSTVSTFGTTNPLLQRISDLSRPFSVYVPGLAGIPVREEYRGSLVVDRGAGRGDANLFLRNVLLRLYRDASKRKTFEARFALLFPGVKIRNIVFDEHSNETIPVEFERNGVVRPLDMIGTGTLQAVQILSYATYYEPSLLLLDEPDAHLHPDNQRKLVQTLLLLTSEAPMQVVLATHSRHLLQELHGSNEVTVFRMKDGSVVDCDSKLADLLMDLGALDKFDNLSLADKRFLVLGEDARVESDQGHPLRVLIESSGVSTGECAFVGYAGCTEGRAASLLATFVAQHHPHVKVVIHRDRDFLRDAEVAAVVMPPYANLANTRVLTTDGSDVESYFVTPEHVAEVCGATIGDAKAWIEGVALTNHNTIVSRFNDKRAALHKQYGKTKDVLEHTDAIRSKSIPLPDDQRCGKDMLKLLTSAAKGDAKFGKYATHAMSSSASLRCITVINAFA